jgi:hypothetical protein
LWLVTGLVDVIEEAIGPGGAHDDLLYDSRLAIRCR